MVMPDGTTMSLWLFPDKHFETTLPAGFNFTGTFLTVKLPPGLQSGAWSYEAVLLDPEVGRTLAHDAQALTVR